VTGGGPEDADALPEPPLDLAKRALPIVRRAAGARYVRVHRMTDGPIWFGWDSTAANFRVPTNRFDSPDGRYGVLYLAATRDGAFAESVGRKPGSFRSNDELAALRLTTLALARDVRIVDLHGGAAVGAMGATGVVGVGPQSLARRWSQALHDHPETPDGIEYRCRHNSDELALALFDRVGEKALLPVDETVLTSDRAWLSQMRARHMIWQPPS
jgi:RES domain